MSIKNTSHLNELWSSLIVEELIRNGANYFCISPGSRSTPLTLAVAQNKKAKSFIHFDERGNAFHALGHATATRKPAVIITTSGSAVANLFPAVVEASKKKIPLIILTADRPPELRFTGANQTIDQVKIFGNYVRWFYDCPTPTSDISPAQVLTTIDQAVLKTQGELRGPVHINCMFREPLAPSRLTKKFTQYLNPINKWLKSEEPFTKYVKPTLNLDSESVKDIIRRVKNIKSGVIAVGKLSSIKEQREVLALAKKLNWPIFADATSGLRLSNTDKQIIHYYDLLLAKKNVRKQTKIDGVIQIGGRLTSMNWYSLLEKSTLKEYIMILSHPLRNDPTHQVSCRIQTSVSEFTNKLTKKISKRSASPLLKKLQTGNLKTKNVITKILANQKELSEAQTIRAITECIPANSSLFVGNSLPIREIDSYGTPTNTLFTITANRGASGIDGNIASAAGFTNGRNKPTTIVLGDLALLYDLNSLAMCKNLNNPFVIVVFNNQGGGIFDFLSVAQLESVFDKYFTTSHELTFNRAAQLFSLNYKNPQTLDELMKEYKDAIRKKMTTLIEIKTNREDNVKIQKQILNAI